jgi:hypothetical protein
MSKRIVLAASALFCAQALQLHAADLKDFPAQTHWILNVDLKAAQASPIVRYVVEQIEPQKKADAQAKLTAFKTVFGVDLLKDIDQLIIVGNGNAEKGGVAYIYGTFDAQRLTSIIAGCKNFASTECNGFSMLSWLDEKDNKSKCLSFAKPGLAVLSSSTAALTDALNAMAGKAPGLPPGSPLSGAFARSPQTVFSLHASDIASIVGQAPKAEMLRQAQTLALRVEAADANTIEASLSATAASDETALQLQQALRGIQALALLQADAKPELATLASLIQISGAGHGVGVTLKLPKSVIEKAVSARQARLNAAAPAPAPAAVN